jgi:hypothetical protein
MSKFAPYIPTNIIRVETIIIGGKPKGVKKRQWKKNKAKRHKIMSKWKPELPVELEVYHSIEAEKELMKLLAKEFE